MENVEIDRTLSLLWGREEPGRRGPKRSLDIQQIGLAAVQVADADGFAAVSMKRLADELGVTSMALYRYVDSKDDLALVMLELASEPPADPLPEGWRAGLEQWARDYRALLLRHPWILQVPLHGPPATPRQLDWMELALGALADTRLSLPHRIQVLLQLSAYVRGDASIAMSVVGENTSPDWARMVGELASGDRYPELLKALGTDEFEKDDDPLDQFEFGLQRMLDGIAQLDAGRR